jgi:hypothetical protein
MDTPPADPEDAPPRESARPIASPTITAVEITVDGDTEIIP